MRCPRPHNNIYRCGGGGNPRGKRSGVPLTMQLIKKGLSPCARLPAAAAAATPPYSMNFSFSTMQRGGRRTAIHMYNNLNKLRHRSPSHVVGRQWPIPQFISSSPPSKPRHRRRRRRRCTVLVLKQTHISPNWLPTLIAHGHCCTDK